jgi:hypothetical protein
VEHPVLTTIRRTGFLPLGWFEPSTADAVPHDAKFVILIGNAGPQMFNRFQRERKNISLDEWTKLVTQQLADDLSAKAVFPFDTPHLPFLSWARRGGAGHVSPLGLNIHATYGLWHAYRAALLFPVAFDLPPQSAGLHPCETCREKPCLTACPVNAFTASSYNVTACAAHVVSPAGVDCYSQGCKARRACPVGKGFTYDPPQAQFFMEAFVSARREI